MAKLTKKGTPEPTPFEPFTVENTFDDPDDAEHILLGLIVARANNSNPFFVDMIEAINEGLQDFRAGRVLAEVEARG